MNHYELLLMILAKCPDQLSRITKLMAKHQTGQDITKQLSSLARDVSNGPYEFSDGEQCLLEAVVLNPQEERRIEVIRFRCTPNERTMIEMMAVKYADGDISKLLRMMIMKVHESGLEMGGTNDAKGKKPTPSGRSVDE